MALTNGKRTVSEIDGIRCSIIEDKASAERVKFLTSLLTFNKLEVKVAQNPAKEGSNETSFTIGVTDVTFNPVIAVYELKLYTRRGRKVTPNYWNEKKEDTNVPYWVNGRPVIEIYRGEII